MVVRKIQKVVVFGAGLPVGRRHLEQPARWVPQQMHAALVDYLGRPVDWHHCAVHRWRYSLPQTQKIAAADSFWWDAAQGLRGSGARKASTAPVAQEAAHRTVRHLAA